MSENAFINVYDPQVSKDQIWFDLQEASPQLPIETSTWYSYLLNQAKLSLQLRNTSLFAALRLKLARMLRLL